MSTGYLQVYTTTASRALPVAGATVKITNTQTGFFQELRTGANGYTQRIVVFARPKESSLVPGPSSTGIPYETYDIEVTAQGFVPVRIYAASVFASQLSLQPVELIPQSEDPARRADRVIEIPPNTLTQPIVRAEPAAPSPRVLGEVTIPKKIRVHLGAPSANARNVSVEFVDYIKNVASSEIYPTWPEQCLRANIHAQISFALNRIYTEHYPSKGYDFDITASPAYDQAFTDGRNIFESVSRIADEIFNEYIRKIGFTEPLAASYCNGVTATCKGMSQWGSLDLANEGKTALEILRYYYGNVEIVQTDNIQETPRSYPGPLRRGDTGGNVDFLQRQLNAIARNFPAVTPIPAVTGNFGAFTENAVRTFQKQFGLAQDGVVGKATWYEISRVYAAVRRLSELDSLGSGLELPPKPPTEVLKNGVRGENVKILQYLLNELALYYDSIPSVAIDSVFGNATKNAVMAAQREFGLPQDGIVGAKTWNALFDAFAGIVSRVEVPSAPDEPAEDTPAGEDSGASNPAPNPGPNPAPNPEPNPAPSPAPDPGTIPAPGCPAAPIVTAAYPGEVLKRGSSGTAVRRIQDYLSYIALSLARYGQPSALAVVVPDGIYGPSTESAVRIFQKRYGLREDGVVGQDTWNKILSVYNAPCR